ncbi:kelch-like protein [Murmansk poxvirus]|uniref:Kelch-like protein n=1 Tax=Murmansk poxvirus TaxID=2025359 RepID=A0A223FN27_9POXV|nr:kelch-like protein [Murmansk poxvirus]AST09395.1 kelch-like protein [Murmansk poxvirus]
MECVNIILGDEIISSDKKLLYSCSSFFKNRFGFDDNTDIDLSSYNNHDLIKQLIIFVNTDKLDIDDKNVQDILVLADCLDIIKARELCTEFIKEKLDVKNCLDIMKYAKFYNFKDIETAATTIIVANFRDIIKDNDFMSLPFDIISSIFENDDLNTKSEDEVMDALCMWMKGDEERTKLVKENISKLIRVDELIYNKNVLKELGCENLPPSVPRKSSGFLYSVGIQDNDSCISTLEKYDRVKDEWEIVSDIPYKIRDCMIAAVGDIVYIICGTKIYYTTTDVYSYNTKTNVWKKEPSTVYPRKNAGVAVVKDHIYLISGDAERNNDLDSPRFTDPDCGYYNIIDEGEDEEGEDEEGDEESYYGKYLKRYNPTMERRCPEDGKWKVVKTTLPVIGKCSATSIGDYIYIIVNEKYIKHNEGIVFCFDTKTFNWTKTIKMNTPRMLTSIIAYNEDIYCIGGYIDKIVEYKENEDDEEPYCVECSSIDCHTIERYNPKTEKWYNDVTDLHDVRNNSSLVVFGDELYVIGGDDKDCVATNNVDVYNHITNRWKMVKQNKLYKTEPASATFVRK